MVSLTAGGILVVTIFEYQQRLSSYRFLDCMQNLGLLTGEFLEPCMEECSEISIPCVRASRTLPPTIETCSCTLSMHDEERFRSTLLGWLNFPLVWQMDDPLPQGAMICKESLRWLTWSDATNHQTAS